MPALTFTTGGAGEWFTQTTQYSYGGSAIQSPPLDNSQEAWIETTVVGPGTLRFDFRVSCDPSECLVLYVDGDYRWGITGRAGSGIETGFR